LTSTLVFQRAVAIRSKFTRRGSPVGFITFDLLAEHKEFDTVVAALRKCWRIESPVQVGADGGRMFDVKDVSWTSEIMSVQQRFLLKAQSLAVWPFPRTGFQTQE
jgi:hypothetical protein